MIGGKTILQTRMTNVAAGHLARPQQRVSETLFCWPPTSELLVLLILLLTTIYCGAVFAYDYYFETSFFYASSSTELWTSGIGCFNLGIPVHAVIESRMRQQRRPQKQQRGRQQRGR